jgi:hypothetical protein
MSSCIERWRKTRSANQKRPSFLDCRWQSLQLSGTWKLRTMQLVRDGGRLTDLSRML